MMASGSRNKCRSGRIAGRASLWALVVTGVGCADAGNQATSVSYFTLFDVGPYLEATRDLAGTSTDALPADISAQVFSRGPVGSETFSLNVNPAFVEGNVAAYEFTESWSGFSAIWPQPMYVLASTNDTGAPVPVEDQPPIFSVGPDSAFSSPYWQVNFALVPPGQDVQKYRSSRAIFQDGLPLVAGPGRLMALLPPGVDITDYRRDPTEVPPHHPLVPSVATQTVQHLQGILDGEANLVDALDYGPDRFTWNSERVVDEAPLFLLRARDASWTLVPTGLPAVGGTGPLFSSTPARETNGRPSFGSLWRIIFAELPTGAGALVPDWVSGAADERSLLASLGLVPVAQAPSDWTSLPDVDSYILRPVLNAKACFAAPSPTDRACQWLDSQAAVEEHLAGSLRTTGILTASPLVSYQGKAVP